MLVGAPRNAVRAADCIRSLIIVAIDFDPGASEVNQLNRIKLMLSTAFKNLKKRMTRTRMKKLPHSLQGRVPHGPCPF